MNQLVSIRGARTPSTARHGRRGLAVPAAIAGAGDTAVRRFLEFFAATIRNKNTRMAYYRAATDFFAWLDAAGIVALVDIEPLHVATYIEALQDRMAKPTVKQHLAAIRMLFDWLVTGGILATNPASGAGLVVRATSDGGADIGVLNDGSISLALSGMIDRIDGNGQRTSIANIERPTPWEIRPAGRNPARLVLPPGVGPIALYNQPISEFWFRPPRPAGDDPRTFQSEILNGELQVLDTGTKIELQPRELVLLEGGSRMLSRLEVIDRAITVDVSGEADRISVGPPRPGAPFRLDRDLTPSVLSYLFGQHELQLLWSISLAVLGALWSARQWALKWRK
jgi:hypothetical protein